MKRMGTAIIAFATLTGLATVRAQGQPFLFGAYPGEPVEQFETEIGHKITLNDHFQKFAEMPSAGIYDDLAAGRTPMLSWSSSQGGDASVRALHILAGKYDQQLTGQADQIAAMKETVLLEWQPEMTDSKRDSLFFAGVKEEKWGPTYVAVWQHIHDIFVARGATNAQWVWSPGFHAYVPHWHGRIPCQPYFPGADYVDWMGYHGYNKHDTPEAYDTDEGFLDFYNTAPLWAPGKPLIHSQTGATNNTDAQREWIVTAQSSLPTEFPLIQGFVYFNHDGNNPQIGQSKQYKLAGAGLQAFSALAADPYFQ